MTVSKPPKVFISYAWEEGLKTWVIELATRLRLDGVEAILDQWAVVPGDQLTQFMEKAVRESDFVVFICTPTYKRKSDRRKGGVGYEGGIITGEIFSKNNHRKFIPILQTGKWRSSAPSWAVSKLFIDLRGTPYSEVNYQQLLSTLLGKSPSAPPVLLDDTLREKAAQELAQKARLEAEEIERRRLAKAQADREAAEKTAREQAEKETAEKARLEAEELERRRLAKEKADREAEEAERHRLAKEEADREAAEKIAREKAERDAAEKARLEAEEAEKRRLAKEKADRDAYEKAAREKAEKEAAEKRRLEAEDLEKRRLAKEQADRETAEKIAREKAEQDAAEKVRLEAEELEKRRIAKERADREAAEKIAREKAERDAAEKARLEAEELARRKALSGKVQPKKVKLNTEIKVVALIGLIGIIAVLISSSPLEGVFSRASEPTAVIISTPTETRTLVPTKTPLPSNTPTKAVTSTPLPTEITDPKGATMRLVPAGEFTMGTDADSALEECKKYRADCQRDSFVDEEPPHQVYLDAFYMDKYEVTNALYKACVDAGGCTPPRLAKSFMRSSYYGNSELDNYPVIYVNWNQAKTYCEWRGGSLPTEAQWEKAARGTDGRTYPWGEGIDMAPNCDNANYCRGDTVPVGSYESGKSPYGIYDLAGNVSEWTADWYSKTYYQNSPPTNPSGPDSGQHRVLRGGSFYIQETFLRKGNWDNYGDNMRTSRRIWFLPDFGVGFRCVRSLP